MEDDQCIKKEIPSTRSVSSEGCITTITGNIKEVKIPSVTTIISEIECPTSIYGQLDYQDLNKVGVPPNNKSDVLILTSGIVKESGEMFLQRTARTDMWFVYICITIINILFLLSAAFGVNSMWYKNIRKSGINPWLIGILWIIATILSYVAIFMIWEHTSVEEIPRDLKLSIYFLIGSFLSLLWATVLFQGNNIGLAVWISAVLFLYQFWLFIYIWLIKIAAALFMIPLIIMYGYLFYSMIHLASINNISL